MGSFVSIRAKRNSTPNHMPFDTASNWPFIPRTGLLGSALLSRSLIGKMKPVLGSRRPRCSSISVRMARASTSSSSSTGSRFVAEAQPRARSPNHDQAIAHMKVRVRVDMDPILLIPAWRERRRWDDREEKSISCRNRIQEVTTLARIGKSPRTNPPGGASAGGGFALRRGGGGLVRRRRREEEGKGRLDLLPRLAGEEHQEDGLGEPRVLHGPVLAVARSSELGEVECGLLAIGGVHAQGVHDVPAVLMAFPREAEERRHLRARRGAVADEDDLLPGGRPPVEAAELESRLQGLVDPLRRIAASLRLQEGQGPRERPGLRAQGHATLDLVLVGEDARARVGERPDEHAEEPGSGLRQLAQGLLHALGRVDGEEHVARRRRLALLGPERPLERLRAGGEGPEGLRAGGQGGRRFLPGGVALEAESLLRPFEDRRRLLRELLAGEPLDQLAASLRGQDLGEDGE